jgi:hypothetical protein
MCSWCTGTALATAVMLLRAEPVLTSAAHCATERPAAN